MGYDRTKGSFLNYASLVIKTRDNRLSQERGKTGQRIAEVNLGGEDDMQS